MQVPYPDRATARHCGIGTKQETLVRPLLLAARWYCQFAIGVCVAMIGKCRQ